MTSLPFPFPQQGEGRRWAADVEEGGRNTPLATTSGARTSPSPTRARASLSLNKAFGARTPLEKQQAPPTPAQPTNADRESLPLFTSGNRAKAWANDCASLRPLRHFIAPSPTSPTPEAAGPTPGGGQRGNDWQETSPPLRERRPALTLQPRPSLRPLYLMAPPLPFSSTRSAVRCS